MELLDEAERVSATGEAYDTTDPMKWACVRVRACESKVIRNFDLATRLIRPPRSLCEAAHFACFELHGAIGELSDIELRTMEAKSTMEAARWMLVNEFDVLREAAVAKIPEVTNSGNDLERWVRRRLFGRDLPDTLRRELVESYLGESVCDELDPYRPSATDRPSDERRAGSNRSMAGSWLLRYTRPDEFDSGREEAKQVLAGVCQNEEATIPQCFQFACFDYFFAQATRIRFSDRFLIWDREPILSCARLRALMHHGVRRSAPALVVCRAKGSYLLFNQTNAILYPDASLCAGVIRWCEHMRHLPVAAGVECGAFIEDILK